MRYENVSHVVVRSFFRRVLIPLAADLELRGLEHVPREGPFIAAANHLSMVDVPLIMALLPRLPRLLAKQDLFRNPLVRLLMRWGGAIKVSRSAMDRAALRTALDTLADGIPVGIFPEGTRVRGGALSPAMNGAGLLALRSGAPVVPVAVTGTPNILRHKRPHLRVKVSVTVGEPLSPEELKSAGGIQGATELIMWRIAALLPPEMRGAYGDKPIPGTESVSEV